MENKESLIVKRNNMFILDSNDYQVLSMLYKPLINHNSLNIYSTLYMISLNDNHVELKSLLFKDMIADDDIKNESIAESIEKLSDVKLLSLSDNEITLYPPYSGKAFFDSPLSEYLSVYTSKKHFNHLSNIFALGEVNVKSPLNNDLSLLSKTLKPYYSEKNNSLFDFDKFKSYISYPIINECDKDFFCCLAYVFSFSLEDMVSIYNDSTDDESYEKEKILKVAYDKYTKNLLKEKRTNSKEKEDDDNIQYLFSNNAKKYLNNLGLQMSMADSNTLYRMRNELNLSDAMILLLVSYSLSTNGNKMHPFVYYSKIIDDWKEKNIKTVEDAYLYIKSLYTTEYLKKDKNTYNKKQKESSEISNEEWFENFWKKAKEEINK